jgi:hypothetical protein
MTMKRILITSGIFGPDIGGPASYARTMGTHLAQQGVEVVVLTYSSVRSHIGDAALPFRVCRIWKKIPWGIRHALFFIRGFFFARHADGILSLNAVSAGLPTRWISRLSGKPFIVRVAGDYAWEMAVQTGRTFLMIDEFQTSSKSGHVRRLDRTQRAVARRASKVIVPSKYLAEMVIGWGVQRERIEVIYNGVSGAPMDVQKEDARRQYHSFCGSTGAMEGISDAHQAHAAAAPGEPVFPAGHRR